MNCIITFNHVHVRLVGQHSFRSLGITKILILHFHFRRHRVYTIAGADEIISEVSIRAYSMELNAKTRMCSLDGNKYRA